MVGKRREGLKIGREGRAREGKKEREIERMREREREGGTGGR